MERAFDMTSLHAAYADGLRPEQVVEECFRRIEAVGDPGIFIHLAAPDAVKASAAALGDFDPVAKPLWGLPFVIKDNIDAAGMPTTAACPAFAYTAEQDAFVVAALKNAGALLIGKTNLDQFATGLVGVRSPHAPPKNALDPTIVPGGSSSGSAVAVAKGLATFSLGTDTAGSGRVPAALNGIVGLKPTLGGISNTGVVPACRSLDTVSIFALTVADAHAVHRVAATYDPTDSFAKPVAVPPLGQPAPTFRLGVPDAASLKFFGDDIQAQSFQDALKAIADMGGDIVELDFTPLYDVAAMLYEGPWVAERLAAIQDFLATSPDEIHPVTRAIIEKGASYSATDTFNAFYRLADLKRAAQPLLDGLDGLCVPSIPTFYSVDDLEADPFTPNARLGTYTNFVNLMDMCGLTVPTAARSDDRPGSVTLLAKAGDDAVIAAMAEALQHRLTPAMGATGWPLPEAPSRVPMAAHDEISLAVVGAHMSGLPLNGELTRLGARFLFASRTATAYQLYSLPGGPPHRPGLIRDPNGKAIALEVWAVPTERFGDFIRGIPRPLGIGTLTLENGEDVKGFICEADGATGARDVTEYGGWRAYLQSLSSSPVPSKEHDHATT